MGKGTRNPCLKGQGKGAPSMEWGQEPLNGKDRAGKRGFSLERNGQGNRDPSLSGTGKEGGGTLLGIGTGESPWRVPYLLLLSPLWLNPCLHSMEGAPLTSLLFKGGISIILTISLLQKTLFPLPCSSIKDPLSSLHGGCPFLIALSSQRGFPIPLPIPFHGESSFPFPSSLH